MIDLDIKGFFDNLDHKLMMQAVEHHIKEPWVLLYIKRRLQAPVEDREGKGIERPAGIGTPHDCMDAGESNAGAIAEGGVISPLLANLFMHYAFDRWLERHIPNVWFERYADDVLIHCCSKQEAESVLEAMRSRLFDCGLTLIVRSRHGNYFAGFLPAISRASAQHIRDTIRELAIPTKRSGYSLPEIAKLINPYVQGWINYFGEFYPSEMKKVLYYVEETLVRWAMGKYKKLRGHKVRAARCLGRIAHKVPRLMAHCRIGMLSAVG